MNAGRPPLKITEVFAWICEEPDGGEGIPVARAMIDGVNVALPLIGADRARIESLRPHAAGVLGMGHPIKLVRFSHMEILERYEPPFGITRA